MPLFEIQNRRAESRGLERRLPEKPGRGSSRDQGSPHQSHRFRCWLEEAGWTPAEACLTGNLFIVMSQNWRSRRASREEPAFRAVALSGDVSHLMLAQLRGMLTPSSPVRLVPPYGLRVLALICSRVFRILLVRRIWTMGVYIEITVTTSMQAIIHSIGASL